MYCDRNPISSLGSGGVELKNERIFSIKPLGLEKHTKSYLHLCMLFAYYKIPAYSKKYLGRLCAFYIYCCCLLFSLKY